MEKHQLATLYPRLYHMANAGSWPLIREHGLLTTQQIVSTAGLPAIEVHQLLEGRRPTSVTVRHPLIGDVTLRDQAPLRIQFLEPTLVDMSVTDWVSVLNDRVFFWLHPDKLDQLLNARRYRRLEQDVLTIDTLALLDAYEEQIRLSPINSGAALYPNAPQRGHSTFMRVSEYDYESRRRGRNLTNAIVELAVIGGVADISRFVLKAERRLGSHVLADLPLS